VLILQRWKCIQFQIKIHSIYVFDQNQCHFDDKILETHSMVNPNMGHAVAQAVSCWLPTAVARVRI
jgi:hypothetical protein